MARVGRPAVSREDVHLRTWWKGVSVAGTGETGFVPWQREAECWLWNEARGRQVHVGGGKQLAIVKALMYCLRAEEWDVGGMARHEFAPARRCDVGVDCVNPYHKVANVSAAKRKRVKQPAAASVVDRREWIVENAAGKRVTVGYMADLLYSQIFHLEVPGMLEQIWVNGGCVRNGNAFERYVVWEEVALEFERMVMADPPPSPADVQKRVDEELRIMAERAQAMSAGAVWDRVVGGKHARMGEEPLTVLSASGELDWSLAHGRE